MHGREGKEGWREGAEREGNEVDFNAKKIRKDLIPQQREGEIPSGRIISLGKKTVRFVNTYTEDNIQIRAACDEIRIK